MALTFTIDQSLPSGIAKIAGPLEVARLGLRPRVLSADHLRPLRAMLDVLPQSAPAAFEAT
jgi:hypothetical protein